MDNNNLKIIVNNIIEYECLKYNITIDEIEFEEDDYDCFRAFVSVTKKKLNLKIVIDLVRFNKYSAYYPTAISHIPFFKSFNIADNELAYLIFSVLHEVGHCHDYTRFYKRTKGNLDIYFSYQEVVKNALHGMFPLNSKQKRKLYIDDYYYQSAECYAEMFAFREFYEVWSMLKSRNLI